MKPNPASFIALKTALRNLQTIPGIGPSLAQDLVSLGITRVEQLKKKNPERLYERLERQTGTHVDRCVLYTFRCAVYFAENPKPDSELLKWWNWKDSAENDATALRTHGLRKPARS
jgi:hypothetical protein